MELIIQAIIVGVSLGFLYGLIGLSLTVIYNSTKVLNFALGDFFMLGGLMTAFAVSIWHFWLIPSLLVIAIVLIIASVLVLKWVIGPLLKSNGIQIALLSTMGVSHLIANVAGIITKNRPMDVAPFIDIPAIAIGPATVHSQYLLLIGFALVFIFAYWYFLQRTRWGIALRAIGMDGEAGRMIGLKTWTMITLSFAISGFIAAFGGSMFSPVSTPIAIMGTALSINGFVAAVLGGLDHPFGAVIGGVIVGVIQSMLTVFTNSLVAEISTFAILIVILVLRPQGILPEKE